MKESTEIYNGIFCMCCFFFVEDVFLNTGNQCVVSYDEADDSDLC